MEAFNSKINFSTSIDKVDDVGGLTQIIFCIIASLPMKYLGLLWELRIMLNQYRMVLFNVRKVY
jgi:hypothetical protein